MRPSGAASKCRDSPGARSSSCVPAAGPGGGEVRRHAPGSRPGAAEAVHARQRQLPAACVLEVCRRDPRLPAAVDAGLQPAQPAVPFLDRDDPLAAGALAAFIAPGEVIAGPAVRPRSVGQPHDRQSGQLPAGCRPGSARPSGGGSERPSRRLGVTGGPACPEGWRTPRPLACRWPAGRSRPARRSAVPPPRIPDAADDVEIIELDAGRGARPQTGHLPGADYQARPGEHPLQFAGFPDTAVAAASRRFHLIAPTPSGDRLPAAGR